MEWAVVLKVFAPWARWVVPGASMGQIQLVCPIQLHRGEGRSHHAAERNYGPVLIQPHRGKGALPNPIQLCKAEGAWSSPDTVVQGLGIHQKGRDGSMKC